MAYIKLNKNREGREYVYLYEGYRENGKAKSRILKSFGKLETLLKEDPLFLDKLKQKVAAGEFSSKDDTKNMTIQIDMFAPITYEDKNYGWKIFESIYNFLEIPKVLKNKQDNSKVEFDLNQILKLLVFQRALAPSSKRATLQTQDELLGNWSVDKNAMYRSLNMLAACKEDIQLKIHESISSSIKREASLVFYDVTNYYFEKDYADKDYVDENGNEVEPLLKLGPSKEKRKNPIVQMGLFMDSNGIPISYKLFPGNHTDPITYIPAIEQVKKQFGLDRVVVVADKAMNSSKNLIATQENNDGYLFSIKHRGRRGASKEIQEFILDNGDWEFNNNLTFAKKSMIRERVLQRRTKKQEEIIVKEKVVVTWNQKYDTREKIRRDGALEYARKLTDAELFRQTSKKGGKKYLDLKIIDAETGELVPFSPLIKINQEEVDYDAQFDGVNVLTTSEIDMSDDEVISKYSELYRIEDCFKITKTELVGRPCYVWKDEQIEGHFLSCYISLVLLRIMQYITNQEFSVNRIITALNSCRANELTNGIYRVQANEDMKLLNNILGIEWNYINVKSEALAKYSKDWFPTFLNTKKSI